MRNKVAVLLPVGILHEEEHFVATVTNICDRKQTFCLNIPKLQFISMILDESCTKRL